MSQRNIPSPPSLEELQERGSIFAKIFEKYGTGRDDNDEGLDMDDWIAIAEAENSGEELEDEEEYDENNIDTEAEALEEEVDVNSEDYQKQLEVVQNIRADPQEQYQRLTYFFDADFIQRMKEAYMERAKEAEQLNLPFFNMRKDEAFSEEINQTADALNISRKYSSTASLTTYSPQVPQSPQFHFQPYIHHPLQDNQFLHRSNSAPTSMFHNPAISSAFPQLFNQQPMFNVYRVREYEFTHINYSASTSGLQQIHLSQNQLQDTFKVPLPPKPIKSRSRAIEAPQHHEPFSRPQSAPPASSPSEQTKRTYTKSEKTKDKVTKKKRQDKSAVETSSHSQASLTVTSSNQSSNDISQATKTCPEPKPKTENIDVAGKKSDGPMKTLQAALVKANENYAELGKKKIEAGSKRRQKGGAPQQQNTYSRSQLAPPESASSESSTGISHAKKSCPEPEKKNMEPITKQRDESVNKQIKEWIKDVSNAESFGSSKTTEIGNPTKDKTHENSKDGEIKNPTEKVLKPPKVYKLTKSTVVKAKECKVTVKKMSSKSQEKIAKELKSSTVLIESKLPVKVVKESKSSLVDKEQTSRHEIKHEKTIEIPKNVKESIYMRPANPPKCSTQLSTKNGESSKEQKSSNNQTILPEKPKSLPKAPETNPIDLLTLNDVSTAGSSLSTDDDDFFFGGGMERQKQRRITHRIKKLQKKKDELRKVQTEAKKKENLTKTQNKIKPRPKQNESGNSTGDDEDESVSLTTVKKETACRVEDRKEIEKKKIGTQQRMKKKVYEICDSDSSD